MKYITNLNDIMVEQLRELYHGDVHLQELLKTFGDGANEPKLKTLIDEYSRNTRDQILSLKKVFNSIFEMKRGEKSETIMAMTSAAKILVSRGSNSEIKDALIILALQRIIHFKIASYGAVCTYGKILGFWDEIKILHGELELEKRIDRKLAVLADGIVDMRVAVN